MTIDAPTLSLIASPPSPLPFAPSLHVRAFLLPRERGDVLVYSAPGAAGMRATRQYLGHRHEAGFGGDAADAPIFVHEADRHGVEKHRHVRATFSRRHHLDEDLEVIPIPGHTPGSTAYLWDDGEHRMLFTADTIYLDDGQWIAAVLGSSDRAAYIESLELLRELDFDVLVPWAASAGQPPYALTDREDARERIGAILERVRGGADR